MHWEVEYKLESGIEKYLLTLITESELQMKLLVGHGKVVSVFEPRMGLMSEQITQIVPQPMCVINQQLKKLEMYGIIEKNICGTSPFRILDYIWIGETRVCLSFETGRVGQFLSVPIWKNIRMSADKM